MRGELSWEDYLKVKKRLASGTKVKIITGSMSPFIKVGQIITIDPFDREKIQRFDPLVFWQENKLICHFFYKTEIQKGEKLYFTKALNGKDLDKPFQEREILGVVTDPKLPAWKRLFMRLLF